MPLLVVEGGAADVVPVAEEGSGVGVVPLLVVEGGAADVVPEAEEGGLVPAVIAG